MCVRDGGEGVLRDTVLTLISHIAVEVLTLLVELSLSASTLSADTLGRGAGGTTVNSKFGKQTMKKGHNHAKHGVQEVTTQDSQNGAPPTSTISDMEEPYPLSLLLTLSNSGSSSNACL